MASSREDSFRRFITAEVEEIQKFKWCLGVRLGYDPLQDRTMNDICEEWICKYAAAFRVWWHEQQQQ